MDTKHQIEILKKSAKTKKQRQVFEGAKEELPPLTHDLKYKLFAAKAASI
jgi:hypothetical protein